FIEDTIKSVLNQTFQDFEIIIVDDGSTDDSFKIASSFQFEKIKLLKQENQGVSIARNNGVDYATSKYIALLDADDLWRDNHLIELKKQIDLFPDAGLYCNNYEIKLHENYIRQTTYNFKKTNECIVVNDFFASNIIDCIPTSSSSAFLKSSFNKIGGYNTSVKSGQDTDLWIRFGLNYDVGFNPAITMTYNNFDTNSLSRSKYNLDRYIFINNYNENEKTNKSLKLYLDINRYALILRSKLNEETHLYLKLKKEIDFKNLNWKQRLLIK